MTDPQDTPAPVSRGQTFVIFLLSFDPPPPTAPAVHWVNRLIDRNHLGTVSATSSCLGIPAENKTPEVNFALGLV